MFDLDEFVNQCRASLAESQPMLAIKEHLDRIIATPDEITATIKLDPGVALLHRSDELTIISVVVPPGLPKTPPHDHRMWALVGIIGGQEDNEFFRRRDSGLVESGARSVKTSDSLAMGDDTIHSIRNPLEHSSLAAIHVYGGDLVGARAERSMWVDPDFTEQPYDDNKVIGPGGFRPGC